MTAKACTRGILFLLGLTLFQFIFSESRGEVLLVSGTITAKAYQGSQLVNIKSNWFEARISGSNSHIFAGPMEDKTIEKFEYGFLGANSYLLLHYTTNNTSTETTEMVDGKIVPVHLDKPEEIENSAMVFINDGHVPEYTLGLIAPVWMAYLFHLDHDKDNGNSFKLTPVLSMGDQFRQLGGRADISYSLSMEKPNFPQSIVETGNQMEFDRLGMKSPAEGVFTNCIYKTSDWTNVNGYKAPVSFIVEYNYSQGNLGAVGPSKVIFEGLATNVTVTLKSELAFILPTITQVVDKRSEVVKPLLAFSYTDTNGILLSREKLKKNLDFQEEISHHR